MKTIVKNVSVALFSILLCFLSYKFCYFLAEKYFFDKFFYQKSVTFGYNYYPSSLSNFGDRNKYLSRLNSVSHNQILETTNENKYIISVIGDSYVWGLGIKNNQRFSKLLEDKLNKIKPTKVITFGEPGNNSLEYLMRFDQIKNTIYSNLYIFTLVSNDAFINQNLEEYDQKSQLIINQCQKKYPKLKPIYEIYNFLESQGYNLSNPTNEISQKIKDGHNNSWINPINICIEKEIFSQLPTKNSIYFITDNYTNDNQNYSIYNNILKETNKIIIDSNIAKNYLKYKKYWDANLWKNFTISPTEGHPNALANQMYADVLFNEITTNPKWNFIK